MKQKLWKIILIIILFRLVSFLFINNSYFLRNFDPQYYADLYSKSQYVIGAASTGGIGDDGLYTFAGYYYLFQRGDVSAVNFEHPPLGKYLIGLSILFFGNENIINIIYFTLLLLITYRLGKIILRDSLLSVIAVGILSFDTLFLDHLLRSLLDMPFALFFTCGVYFFLAGLRKSKYFYLSMVFWGAAFSTRFFPAIIIIYILLFTVLFLSKRKYLPGFLIASVLIPVIYLISHTSFFVYHPSVVEFLRHKKWMLEWFRGTPVIFGNIWRNILTGYYLDSTYLITRNEHWNITIPIVIISALVPVRKFITRLNLNFIVVYGLSIIYIAYLTFLTGGLQKFLMPVYPLFSILAVKNLSLLYNIICVWMRRK